MARPSPRSRRRGRRPPPLSPLLRAAALSALPQLARAAAEGPADLGWRSAYSGLAASLARAGGCGAASAGEASEEDAAAASFACALGCRPHEGVLEKGFEPWWDHKLRPEALHQACSKVAGAGASQAFMGAISSGRVFYKCCSPQGGQMCDPGQTSVGPGMYATDVQVILSLVGEVAEGAPLPDMYFLFNTGDQPFTDKVNWNPVPQFHWVESLGHWGIPLPNPFHLKAHFMDRLGDSSAHAAHHVPWSEKLPKVFWRGTLSAPDHHIFADTQTMPRVRLMLIAEQHPELFDVAITGVDDDLRQRNSEAEMAALLKRLPPQQKHVDMASSLPRFRYVLNVCAVLSSWRLVELLASGSLLLLQDDPTSELIYQWLTPWEHFVPVRASLSDLVTKVQWLEAHPERAEAIARQGFLQFQRRVRRQDTHCYLWQALRTLANATGPTELPPPERLQSRGWREVDFRKLGGSVPTHKTLRDFLREGRSAEL